MSAKTSAERSESIAAMLAVTACTGATVESRGWGSAPWMKIAIADESGGSFAPICFSSSLVARCSVR